MKKLFPNANVILTKHFDVHQDWSVPIPGFFIIASKRKIFSVDDFTKEEAFEFIELVKMLRHGMREVLNIESVYFFQREDSEDGFHFWVFPRYDWMEKFGFKIQSVRLIIDYAKKEMNTERIKEEVIEAVSKMKGYMKKFD